MAWTKEETEFARQQWLDGVSAAKIGMAIGKSRNSVIGKLCRLKVIRQRPKLWQGPAPITLPKLKCLDGV